MSGSFESDYHRTRLTEWTVNLVGRALLISTALGVVAAMLGGQATDSGGGAAIIGVAVAFIAFSVQLMLASAPAPLDEDDSA